MKKLIVFFYVFLFAIGANAQTTFYAPAHYKADMSFTPSWNTRTLIDKGFADKTYFNISKANTTGNAATTDSINALAARNLQHSYDSLNSKLATVVYLGSTDPRGTFAAPPNSLYIDTHDTTVFIKMVGTGNTGWFSVRQK